MLKLLKQPDFKPKPNMELLWINAFINSIEKGDTIKSIVSGVKFINASRRTTDKTDVASAQRHFAFIEYIQILMSQLTPREFMQLFPIEKKYDGKKYECKDYFSTIDYIRKLDIDKPIGDKRALFDFLWEYQNWDIVEFTVEIFSSMDNLMHLQGKEGPIDKLIDDLGITPYYIQKDEATGQEYLLNGNTGKSMPMSKPIPRYLNVVK